MSMIMSLRSNSIRSLNILNRHRLLAGIRPFSPLEISTSKRGWFYLDNQRMQSSISRGDDLPPGDLPPPTPDFRIWGTCILGSIVSLTLTLGKIKDNVESVEEGVEGAVEIVEEVAEVVEELASEVGDKITKDGILKDAVSWVEKASKEVKDFARQTLGFFYKVDEIKEEVEKGLETLLEHHENDGEREGQDPHGGKEKGEGEGEIQGRKEKGEGEIQGRKEKGEKETQEESKNENNEGQGRKENEEKEAQGRKKAQGKKT